MEGGIISETRVVRRDDCVPVLKQEAPAVVVVKVGGGGGGRTTGEDTNGGVGVGDDGKLRIGSERSIWHPDESGGGDEAAIQVPCST